jgi:hypothetical protein
MVLVNPDGTLDERGAGYFVFCLVIEVGYFVYPVVFCWLTFNQVALLVRSLLMMGVTTSINQPPQSSCFVLASPLF